LKALGALRSRDSLRSSLRCGAYVVRVPGPALALSVLQDRSPALPLVARPSLLLGDALLADRCAVAVL